jgi:hypothetical protein
MAPVCRLAVEGCSLGEGCGTTGERAELLFLLQQKLNGACVDLVIGTKEILDFID